MKKTLSILLAAMLACSTIASASAATMATESSKSTTATMASTSDATMATESSVDMSFTVDEAHELGKTSISFVIPEGAKPGDVFELILVEEALESGKRISIVIPEGAKPGDILDLILPELDGNGNFIVLDGDGSLILNEGEGYVEIHFVDVPDDAEVGEDGYVVYGPYEGTTGEATAATEDEQVMTPSEGNVDMSFTVDEALELGRTTISFVIPEGAKPGDVFELILLDFDGKESLTVEEALESGKRISIVIPEGAKPGDILDLILPEPDDNGNLTVDEALDSDKIHFVDVPDDAEVGEDGYVVYGPYEGTTGEATAATEDEQVMTPSEDNVDMSFTVDETL